jgi:hypothetical protein
VEDIQVRRECKDKPAEPNSLNIERLNARAREQIDKKKKLVMAMKAGVSPEGQRLLTAIDKTINEVHWSGEDECDQGRLFEAITEVNASDDRQDVKAAQVRDHAQAGVVMNKTRTHCSRLSHRYRQLMTAQPDPRD